MELPKPGEMGKLNKAFSSFFAKFMAAYLMIFQNRAAHANLPSINFSADSGYAKNTILGTLSVTRSDQRKNYNHVVRQVNSNLTVLYY